MDVVRRLRECRLALVRLSPGKARTRWELFDDHDGASERWQIDFLRRLSDAELVIRHGKRDKDPMTVYEAVDGSFLRRFVDSESFSKWMLYPNQAPAALAEFVAATQVPAPAPPPAPPAPPPPAPRAEPAPISLADVQFAGKRQLKLMLTADQEEAVRAAAEEVGMTPVQWAAVNLVQVAAGAVDGSRELLQAERDALAAEVERLRTAQSAERAAWGVLMQEKKELVAERDAALIEIERLLKQAGARSSAKAPVVAAAAVGGDKVLAAIAELRELVESQGGGQAELIQGVIDTFGLLAENIVVIRNAVLGAETRSGR